MTTNEKNTKSIEKSSKETEAIKSKAELFLQSLKVKIMKKEETVKIVNKDEIEEEVKKTLQLIKQKEEVKKENIKLLTMYLCVEHRSVFCYLLIKS